MKMLRFVLILVCVSGLLGAPALAQTGAAEASGSVIDQDGAPVKGAKVTFTPKAIQSLSYDAKTNKKGKFWAAGLYTSHQDNEWIIAVERQYTRSAGTSIAGVGAFRNLLPVDSIMKQAEKATGLSDWGDEDFLTPLELLTRPDTKELRITLFGKYSLRGELVRCLRNRCQRRPLASKSPGGRPFFFQHHDQVAGDDQHTRSQSRRRIAAAIHGWFLE